MSLPSLMATDSAAYKPSPTWPVPPLKIVLESSPEAGEYRTLTAFSPSGYEEQSGALSWFT
jgi:hypothetical protein